MKKKFNIALFLLYFLLSSGVGIYVSISGAGFKMLALHLAHGFLIAWCFSFLNSILPGKVVRGIINGLALTILSISFLTDIICVTEFNSTFTEDFIALVLGSDPSESSEFIALHRHGVLLGAGLLMVMLVCAFLFRKFSWHLPKPVFIASVLLLIPCLILINVNPNARKNLLKYNSAEGKIYMMAEYMRNAPPDFKRFVKPADIAIIGEQPANIVLVFGESHCRSHCPFYGYDKMTMPQMQAMIDKGEVQAFSKVSSPDINTQKSFKSLMSTYIPEYGDSIRFYTCQTLPQVIREAGYHSCWISNQSKRGFYDNVIGNFADLCDTSLFNGDKFSGTLRKDLDGELIPIVESTVRSAKPGKNFYVIHLMGSHHGFRDRYPADFDFYQEADYPDRPAHQRYHFATYDNSIRYTDYVLSSLIGFFVDKETILLYVSDHGLDFYDTDPGYCDHALSSETESGRVSKEVPFLVYTSPLYRQHFPDMTERIRESTEREYRTDSLIYTIMDIAGAEFRHPEEPVRGSLFQDDGNL
jgi:heptose-I-phosphate ethanolaminephosphotransferase